MAGDKWSREEECFLRDNYYVLPVEEIASRVGRTRRAVVNHARDVLGLRKVEAGAGGMLTEYPDVLREWHPSKNLPVLPESVGARSNRKFWWQCSKNPKHVWPGMVSNRTRGARCPYCAGKAVLPEESLLAKFPELAAEWHPSNNGPLRPDGVTAGSGRSIVWRCSVNPDHVWSAKVTDRVNKGSGCPECAQAHESRVEIVIRFEVAALLGVHDVVRRVETAAGPVVVDFCSPGLKLVIEYDGAYWHSEKDEADAEKSRRLRECEWRVVRVREEPLRLLTNDDVSVRQNAQPRDIAIVIADHLQRRLSLKLDSLDDYRSSGKLLCAAQITEYLKEKRTRTPLVCDHCGREYFVKRSKHATSHYCSKACYRAAGHTVLVCESCGQQYTIIKGRATSTRRFCSRQCAAAASRRSAAARPDTE